MNIYEQQLQSLKKHKDFPFDNFENDAEQFQNLKLYWFYLFQSVVNDENWKEWFPAQKDGNPILDVVNINVERAVRIIHHNRSQKRKLYIFQPWLDIQESKITGLENDVLELVFSAEIFEESEKFAKQFLKKFCIELAAENEMENMIYEYTI